MNPALGTLNGLFLQLTGWVEPAPATAPEAAAEGEAKAAAAPPAPPVAPVQLVEHGKRGVDLDVTVAPDQVVEAAELVGREGYALDAVTGVDWIADNQMEVVYDFFHPVNGLRVAVRTRIPRDNPEVDTIIPVFSGANWHERETHDFFGIRFRGHPNLTPFLLPEDADFHPLRKDYQP